MAAGFNQNRFITYFHTNIRVTEHLVRLSLLCITILVTSIIRVKFGKIPGLLGYHATSITIDFIS